MMRFGRIIDPFLGERAPVAMAQTGFDAGEAHHRSSVFLPHGSMHSPEAWDAAVGRYRAHPGPMGYSDDMTAR